MTRRKNEKETTVISIDWVPATMTRTARGRGLVIQGARVLTHEGLVDHVDVAIQDGRIAGVGCGLPKAQTLDGRGLWLLPGIVDLHGDAFERVQYPRPGVGFPLELSLQENERMLLSNGITSFFYSIADSFEPGVRGRDVARQLIARLKGSSSHLRVHSFVHLRHEESQTKGQEELVHWLEARQVDLLSFNDHLPDLADEGHFARYLKSLRLRAAMPEEEARRMVREATSRREEGQGQCAELARLARKLNLTTASHDDDQQRLALSIERGVSLIEFPMNTATAKRAKEHGFSVLMGAPNVVQGGSHLGWLSVRDAVKAGTVDLLCSDYHYPSLLAAPFILARAQRLRFEDAWRMVSAIPANVAGLGKRKGAIQEGFDADLVLVEAGENGPVRTRVVLVGGRMEAVFPD